MLNVERQAAGPAVTGKFRASDRPRRTGMPAVADFCANQGAWWWCVLWALDAESAKATSVANVAIMLLAPAAYLAVHLALDSERRDGAALFALGAALGWAGDTLLIQAGLIYFPSAPAADSSPVFMLALWAMFAVSLRASGSAFVTLRPWLRVVVAAAAGPVAYLGGQRLGVLELEFRGVFAVALEWAVVAPLWAAAATALARSRAPRSPPREVSRAENEASARSSTCSTG